MNKRNKESYNTNNNEIVVFLTSAIPIAILKAIKTPTCARAAKGVNSVRAPLVPTLRPSMVAPPNFRARTPPGS